MGKLFGTDGIRGKANVYPMTTDIALSIGKAIAYLFKRKGHRPRILIGKDTRLSGYMIESALQSGICSMGVDAVLLGPLPTPGIAFNTRSMRADAGIVISASHNPYQDNGIKIFAGSGYKLPDEKEAELEELVFSNNWSDSHPEPGDLGKAYRMNDAEGRYIVFLKNTFPKDYTLEGMKVVLDCANGATYQVAPQTFFELGAQVNSLFVRPNGTNINLECGSMHPEALAEEVVGSKADIGLAFDGDGDRLIAVDENGNVISGDQILAICAKVLKEENRLPNNRVVSTVMSNLGLNFAFKDMGIELLKASVGDRYVLEMMQANGSIIGGENSGHMIFLEHHTTGDGVLTALQLLAAIQKEGKPLSELARVMTIFPQSLINIDVKTKPEISEVPEIMQAIRQVEDELGEQGRVLVRYSGTQAMCRVMVEGPTQSETDKYCRRIADTVTAKLG